VVNAFQAFKRSHFVVNFAVVAPIVVVVASHLVYHLAQKGIPTNANPYASLLVSYALALTLTLVGFIFFNTSKESPWVMSTWTRLNWASLGVGVSAVGLELGYLWAYRVGWKLSFAALYTNVLVTLALIPIGVLFYQEGLSGRKWFGIFLALSGIWALSGL
jgi:multidrug transporter EmrE-like cation transporter